MQHLGPRRAHPRALAGGENDCQTCAALKMKGDHETYFSTRGGVSLESRMGNTYSHKIENSLARNLCRTAPGVQTSLGILPGKSSADRIETGEAWWRKNSQKGTYVRPVIVYRDKTKAF